MCGCSGTKGDHRVAAPLQFILLFSWKAVASLPASSQRALFLKKKNFKCASDLYTSVFWRVVSFCVTLC